MAIIKCKNCGGDIEISADKTFGTCEYCGSTMTFPKVSDEQRLAAFNRGNHFRRIGEFDKALSVYERIVEEDPTDAEAHWCCALCRFGIEYVEDPSTYEYVPTCHRASFDNFLEDVDYLAAIENSDGITRKQYMREAAKISDVQRNILSTCQKEEPFDVFICYKETDDAGNRTKDSALAQDIYYQLTDQGLRVFFARITLEDKAGTEYEPYIFAALNSAKVMITVSTKPEYMNAVWVKNEWSRFLSIIKKDRSKVILPCYRDMDPYDLPEQLSVLQSYDMTKIGFIQDLIRGIGKIVNAEAPKTAASETVVINNAGTNAAPLLERAFLFLEDGKWDDADAYCEKVLDIDPKNAEAYLGKLMAEMQIKVRSQLADCKKPFDNKDNFSKIIRFGDGNIQNEIKGYITHINERNENERLTGIYNKAVQAMNDADSESGYKSAAEIFKSISNFKDSASLLEECIENAELSRKNSIYNSAKSKMCGNQVDSYEKAIELFKTISGWSDTDEQIGACQKRIEEIYAKEEADRIEAERKAEEMRLERERRERELNEQTDAVVAAIRANIEKQRGKSLETLLKEKAVECARIEAIINDFDDNIYQINELNNQIDLWKKQSSEYEARKSKLGLFSGKEKKQLESQIAELSFKCNDAQSRISSIKEKLDGFQTKEDVKKAYSRNIADKQSLETKIKENERLKNRVLSYTYDQAIALMKKDRQLLEKVYEKEPDAGFIFAGELNIVYFGRYDQDNTYPKPIEWEILDRKDNKALLISKFALECRKYHNTFSKITWEKCDLRKWLNSEFLNTVFNQAEQGLIADTYCPADKNPKHDTSPGNATTDKVFLLSIPEAEKYFSTDSKRRCAPTAYAKAQGAYTNYNNKTADGEAACWWWLRSPGYISDYAAYVDGGGSVDYHGLSVSNDNDCVRPALWINLGS